MKTDNDRKTNKGKLLIFTGLLLIAAALFLIAYNLYEQIRAERSADQALECLEKIIPTEAPTNEGAPNGNEAGIPSAGKPEWPDYVLNPDMDMPVEEVNGVNYIGILRIPALELSVPVINKWSGTHLKLAPCRYNGSAYLDDFVIAGHYYPCFFGALRTLSPGDAVIFTDMDGNVFYYEVAAMEVLTPAEVEEMISSGYALTLFTCTPDVANRIAVRCDRVGESGRRMEAKENG